MAKDAELDRLKSAQDAAFQCKQSAYDAQNTAWNRRVNANTTMCHAYDEKQRVYAEQTDAWNNLQRIRDRNGPQIDRLNAQQEAAFQKMKQAFDNASAAHDRRDGASARSYADDGHRYKTEAQGCVNERRRLVEEIRSARAQHKAMRLTFQRAKAEFDSAKRAYDATKADYMRVQQAFEQAKAEFDQAVKAFKFRLEVIKAASQKQREDWRNIAQQASVPYEYLNNTKVRRNSDGSYDVFYGGAGRPDGFGHGHATLDRFGKATHDRRPFDTNHPENFADENSYIEFQRSKGHRGGWGLAHHGYIEGCPVTFALGWGSKEDEILLSDGHTDKRTFHRSGNHNHYGREKGPNLNVRDRGLYTGPGA